jgi:hypothetical protein
MRAAPQPQPLPQGKGKGKGKGRRGRWPCGQVGRWAGRAPRIWPRDSNGVLEILRTQSPRCAGIAWSGIAGIAGIAGRGGIGGIAGVIAERYRHHWPSQGPSCMDTSLQDLAPSQEVLSAAMASLRRHCRMSAQDVMAGIARIADIAAAMTCQCSHCGIRPRKDFIAGFMRAPVCLPPSKSRLVLPSGDPTVAR